MNKELGKIIKSDSCPEGYDPLKKLLKLAVPFIVFLIAVMVLPMIALSDFLVVWIIFELFLVGAMCLLFLISSKRKKNAKEFKIDVCEYGITGVCFATVFKNKEFFVKYDEIKKIKVQTDPNGYELTYIFTKKGKIFLVLKDTAETTAIIRSKTGK